MELLAIGLAVAVVMIVVGWLRVGRGKRATECWQCGYDLTGCQAKIDFRGDRRCPRCGELVEDDEPGRVDRL